MPRRPITADILHEALRRAPDAITVTDAELNVVYVNREELGSARDDAPSPRHGAFESPEQRRKLELVFERARATGQAQHYETSLDAPDGERHYYSNQVSAYEAEGGSGMISVRTDVTRQHAAEQRIDELRHELSRASQRAGMAEIATGVLHNVGNVLNSVNVSSEALMKELETSRLHLLSRTVAMLEDNEARLPEFLTEDPRGRKLPALLGKLGQELEAEQQRLHAELSRLRRHLGLMRSIVEAQQSIAKLGDVTEPVRPDELVHQTLTMFQLDLESRIIDLRLELDDVGSVVLDKQATLQVLANLIRNAIEALEVVERSRQLVIRLFADDQKVYFDVEDNGTGIREEHVEMLFQHGFSTKPNGHGFGLHTSAIAARTMNGTLEVHSDGPDKGARLRLTLPRNVP